MLAKAFFSDIAIESLLHMRFSATVGNKIMHHRTLLPTTIAHVTCYPVV